jgi:hypothetical protein
MTSAAALHSFVLPKDPSTSSSSSPIQPFPTEFPMLDYTLLPGSKDEILLTLDTTFGIVTFNQESGQRAKPDLQISEEQKGQMQKSYKIVKVAEDGSVRLLFLHPLRSRLIPSLPISLLLIHWDRPSRRSSPLPRTRGPGRLYHP